MVDVVEDEDMADAMEGIGMLFCACFSSHGEGSLRSLRVFCARRISAFFQRCDWLLLCV